MHAVLLLLVTLPAPWWEVTSGLGARAVSFREKEIIFVDTKDRVRVRSGMLHMLLEAKKLAVPDACK